MTGWTTRLCWECVHVQTGADGSDRCGMYGGPILDPAEAAQDCPAFDTDLKETT